MTQTLLVRHGLSTAYPAKLHPSSISMCDAIQYVLRFPGPPSCFTYRYPANSQLLRSTLGW